MPEGLTNEHSLLVFGSSDAISAISIPRESPPIGPPHGPRHRIDPDTELEPPDEKSGVLLLDRQHDLSGRPQWPGEQFRLFIKFTHYVISCTVLKCTVYLLVNLCVSISQILGLLTFWLLYNRFRSANNWKIAIIIGLDQLY